MWKTVGITLAVIFGTIAIVFGALTLFFPRAMGDLFSDMGNYSGAVWFYEKQYNASSDVGDLVVLVSKLDEVADSEKTEKYSSDLIAHKDFNVYLEGQGKTDFISSDKAKEYFYAKNAVSKTFVGKMAEAISVSKIFVEHYGYTLYNPFRIIIATCGNKISVEDLSLLKSGIEGLMITENQTVEKDIQDIQTLINAKGE